MDTLKDTIVKLKNELKDKSKRIITLEHDYDELKTKNNQLEESIRAVSSRLEQIEKV